MSFLMDEASSSYLPSKRKKYNEDKRKPQPNDKHEDLIVVGYQSKIFRDDVMAKYIEDERHLIPWMGNESLMIDRYDGRGHLYNQEEFNQGDKIASFAMTKEEELFENELNRERYLALEQNLVEESFREEEERKRFHNSRNNESEYNNIGFQYQDASKPGYDGDEEYDPNECIQDDDDQDDEGIEPAWKKLKQANRMDHHTDVEKQKYAASTEPVGFYEKPADLEVPEGVEMPDSQKSHSIIEKTALLISKHGTQMEIVLKAKQAGNPQFDFLNFGNWLNPYYKLILEKIRNGKYKLNEMPTSAPQMKNTHKQDSSSKESSRENSNSENSDDDDDEYLNPILQAHRRPVKTNAIPTANSSTNSKITSRGTESPLPPKTPHNVPPANAAAVYMARKYENTRQGRSSPKEITTNDGDLGNDENWANDLEEDRNYQFIDNNAFQFMPQMDQSHGHIHPAFTMMPPPPPPPGQEDQPDPFKDLTTLMHASHMLPPPPPPPGSTDAEVTSFQSSNSSHLYPGQQQQQQHIVPPPPDLKAVVDKLADYVSRNGEEFEEQVKRKNDPRFDFLKIDNLYFPYYMYKKQHFIREIAMQKAKEEKEREERASKPLSFALKSKKTKKPEVKEVTRVEVFKKEHDESGSEAEQDADELDGYRPNKANSRKSKQENKELSNEEKAKIAMEKAKIMIAEAQKKQEEMKRQSALQGDANEANQSERERQIQIERRRRAAAFIGMLKQSNPNEQSSSSDESSDDESSNESETSDDENVDSQPKRHFQEKRIIEDYDDDLLEQKLQEVDKDSEVDE